MEKNFDQPRARITDKELDRLTQELKKLIPNNDQSNNTTASDCILQVHIDGVPWEVFTNHQNGRPSINVVRDGKQIELDHKLPARRTLVSRLRRTVQTLSGG